MSAAFFMALGIVVGFATMGVGVGFTTWVAGVGLRLSDRFGGVVFWMAWAFSIVIPLYLASLVTAAAVGVSIASVGQ